MGRSTSPPNSSTARRPGSSPACRACGTGDFNLNLLRRINRELAADFDLDRFQHDAFFNPSKSRIEMHLASRVAQKVRIGDDTIRFARGETIHTESSYKYTVESFQA